VIGKASRSVRLGSATRIVSQNENVEFARTRVVAVNRRKCRPVPDHQAPRDGRNLCWCRPLGRSHPLRRSAPGPWYPRSQPSQCSLCEPYHTPVRLHVPRTCRIRSKSVGNNGCGTVFELSPSGSTWKFRVLHVFQGTNAGDGALPWGTMIMDKTGSLLGTTFEGGNVVGVAEGVVYRLSRSASKWREQVLHSFSGSDGQAPISGLSVDQAGNYYVTTLDGGLVCGDCGTIFELSPPRNGGGWTFTSLYSFTFGSGGGQPYGGVVPDVRESVWHHYNGRSSLSGRYTVRAIATMRVAYAGQLKAYLHLTVKPRHSRDGAVCPSH